MSEIVYSYHWHGNERFAPEVEWVLHVFSQYAGIKWQRSLSDGIRISEESESDIQVNAVFFERVLGRGFAFSELLSEHLHVVREGELDELSTAFYFLNCLWERAEGARKDSWGRSEFEGSVWEGFQLSAPETVVNRVFDRLAQRLGIQIVNRSREVFLSHDIDVVYGGWKEDGLAALKRGEVFSMLALGWQHLMKRPTWFNFEQIASMEAEYDYVSTFFWLPKEGKVPGIGTNADYSLEDARIRKAMSELSGKGCTHGIHKSIAPGSIREELDVFDREILANRHHYLKFDFEQLIPEMEASGLKMDASLGYASVPGYRNGYSLPFVPYNLDERRPSTFVEVPLCLMDGTFSKYQGLEATTAFEKIWTWFESAPKNAVISILWHNSHFTDFKYKGYPKLYTDLLAMLRSEGVECTTPEKLIHDFHHVNE